MQGAKLLDFMESFDCHKWIVYCCFPHCLCLSGLSSGVQILPAVLAPTVVLITLTALLCVAICVVCKIRRQEPTMYVTACFMIDFFPLHLFNQPY